MSKLQHPPKLRLYALQLVVSQKPDHVFHVSSVKKCRRKRKIYYTLCVTSPDLSVNVEAERKERKWQLKMEDKVYAAPETL
jgi:hypothetical protein